MIVSSDEFLALLRFWQQCNQFFPALFLDLLRREISVKKPQNENKKEREVEEEIQL